MPNNSNGNGAFICDCCERTVSEQESHEVQRVVKIHNNSAYRINVRLCKICCARMLGIERVEGGHE